MNIEDLVDDVQAALAEGNDLGARELVLGAAASAPTGSDGDDWELVELCELVEEPAEGLRIARGICERSPGVDNTIRYAHVLAGSGDVDEALERLRQVLPQANDEQALAIVEHLALAAMAQGDAAKLEGMARGELDTTSAEAREWAAAGAKRALTLHAAGDLGEDARRTGYALGGHVVLGAEGCEGDRVADYWFFMYDPYAIAWALRRFIHLAAALGWSFAEVRAGNLEAEPVARALAELLTQSGARAGKARRVLRVFGSVDDADEVGEIPEDDVVLALAYDSAWHALRGSSRIDVVGVLAPGEMVMEAPDDDEDEMDEDFDDEDLDDEDLDDEDLDDEDLDDEDLDDEDEGMDEEAWMAMSQELARAIVREYGELPPDTAMDAIIAFYQRHRERTPALRRAEA